MTDTSTLRALAREYRLKIENQPTFAVTNLLVEFAERVQSLERETHAPTRDDTLRVLALAVRKVLSPELVALVEAEIRRGLAEQYAAEGEDK